MSEGQLIHLGWIITHLGLANTVKTTVDLGSLGDSTINRDIQIPFKGYMNKHAANVTVTELKSRALGLEIKHI
jgi:hypothetical protein